MKNLFIIYLLFFTVKDINAQKNISIDYERTHKSFDLRNAEIYFVIGSDSLFLTKISEYKFQFSQEWFPSNAKDSKEKVDILVVTPKKVYSFKKRRSVFDLSNNFTISFRKFGRIHSKYGRMKDVIFEYEQSEIVSSVRLLEIRKRKKKKKKKKRRLE